MPYAPFDWIDAEARGRAAAGLVRTLRPRGAEPEPLDLASNDYLGLTRHPEVTAAAGGAAPPGGGGATGGRLVY
ncbi:8-amino-7-oxononanoate synthase, partial [Streptomyces californicus]